LVKVEAEQIFLPRVEDATFWRDLTVKRLMTFRLQKTSKVAVGRTRGGLFGLVG